MKQPILLLWAILFLITGTMQANGQKRMRDFGINTGIFKTGENNAITDVPGVTVGHVTCIVGDDIRTGVTAIVPHQGNIFQKKVPAGIYAGNGFGKLAGSTQVQELGNITDFIFPQEQNLSFRRCGQLHFPKGFTLVSDLTCGCQICTMNTF